MSTANGIGKTGQIASTLAVIIAGRNTFGEVENFNVPEFEFEVVNGKSTGILKEVSTELTFLNLEPSFLEALKKGEPFIAKGSYRENNQDYPYSFTLSMDLHKIGTEIKEGENMKRTVSGVVNTFEEVVNGKQAIKYNRDTMTYILGGDGINLMADISANTN